MEHLLLLVGVGILALFSSFLYADYLTRVISRSYFREKRMYQHRLMDDLKGD